ncbi:MAG: hypothetical protein ACI85Q_001282 [Salibacteraceae bacterium]|jgi:hypothetical protein
MRNLAVFCCDKQNKFIGFELKDLHIRVIKEST